MNRRQLIAGVGSIGLASLAGCLGAVGLDEHEATPGGVEPSVRDETGYERTGVDDLTIEEEVGVAAYSEEIVVTNYLTEHEKAVDMGPLGDQRGAVFVLLSTPQIGVAGRNVNPVEEKSTTELVELVESNYDDISDVEHVEDDTVTVLGQSTTESTFTADAEFDGSSVDVNLHVTEAVETDEDLLVAIGVYPQHVEGQERPNVRSLMEGIVETVDDEGQEDDGDGGADDDTSEGSDDTDGDGSDGSESGDETGGDDGNDGDDEEQNDSDDDDDGIGV